MGGYAALGFPALMVKPPESPLQQFGQVENILAQKQAIAGEQQRQELGNIQLQQARIDANSRATLMKIWADNDGDLNQTVADAKASGQVTPEHLQQFQIGAVQLQTQAALLQKDQLENKKTIYDMAANKLDAVKALPIGQRGQALMDAYGDLLKSGADPNDVGQHVQALVNNPSDDAITNYQTSIKGATWAADQQLKELELASKPTAAQAQAKTAAELQTAQDEATMKHVAMLSQEPPEFAATLRQANLAKTRAETAKDEAETAKAKSDTMLTGFKPVIAQNPSTKQYEIVPLSTAKSGAYGDIEEANPDLREKYVQISSQLAGVQAAMSHYRHAEQNPNLQKDDAQDRAMASIISDTGILGTLAKNFPIAGSVGDVVETLRKAQRWESLDDAHQQLLATYLTGKVSSIAFQKITTGVGRLPAEGMRLEFDQVPSPTQAGNSSFKAQMDQYQDRINVASTQIVKVPGIATPAEVRQAIESQKTPLQPIPRTPAAQTNLPPTIQNVGAELLRQANSGNP